MLKKYNGFTLAEVVISFVLISIIGLLVGHTFTSAYAMSSKLEEIPKDYYKAQTEIENEILTLSNDINECYNLENEMSGKADSEIKPEILARYNELVEKLNSYSKKTIHLFEKDVDLYTFSNNEAGTKIIAGGVNFVSHNHTIPILSNVIINDGKLDSYGLFERDYDIYHRKDRKIYANATVDYKNSSALSKIKYDWYICDEKYHTVPFKEGYSYSSRKFLEAFPMFPDGFKLIKKINGTNNFIKIKDDYANRLLVCVATPISEEGSAGIPKVSNYVYVSGLPTTFVSKDNRYDPIKNVIMLIDPSLELVNYTDADEVDLKEINSRYNDGEKNIKLYAQGSHYPKLNLVGSMTNSEYESNDSDQFYSRYIKFDSNTSMKTSNFNSDGKAYLYIVARDRFNEGNDFIFTDSRNYGFKSEDGVAMSEPGCEGWQIVITSVSDDELIFGKSNVDIAEIVALKDIRHDDTNEKILDYLSSKYDIDVDDLEDEELN